MTTNDPNAPLLAGIRRARGAVEGAERLLETTRELAQASGAGGGSAVTASGAEE